MAEGPTGSFSAGLLAMSGFLVLAALLASSLKLLVRNTEAADL